MSSSNNLQVAKFGGTSLANYEAMCRCAQIVLNDQNIKAVVVSASSGVTNLLVQLSSNSLAQSEIDDSLNKIRSIQNDILNGLQAESTLVQTIDKLILELKQEIVTLSQNYSSKQVDLILSFGEQMSSLLFAEVLNQLKKDIVATHFDVRNVMRTDSSFGNARPQLDDITDLATEHLVPLMANKIVVLQGFIGSDKFGNTTTLGRGGSDYSAALISEAVNASAVQIWTDVPGIYTTDPRITGKAKPMPELSFSEAAELATFGAKVLHPATILPAARANIDVFVGSSVNPELGGTWIRKKPTEPGIRAIALREKQTLLTVSSPNMLHASGFLARVFAILAKFELSVDLITTSEISVALTIDKAPNNHVGVISDECIAELASFCEVKVETDLALVAAIGDHRVTESGTDGAKKLFNSLSNHPLRMICHGASIHNICFLVEQNKAKQVVQSIHDDVFCD